MKMSEIDLQDIDIHGFETKPQDLIPGCQYHIVYKSKTNTCIFADFHSDPFLCHRRFETAPRMDACSEISVTSDPLLKGLRKENNIMTFYEKILNIQVMI